MWIIDIFRLNKIKHDLEDYKRLLQEERNEVSRLTVLIKKTGHLSLSEAEGLTLKYQKLCQVLESQNQELQKEIQEKSQYLVSMDDRITLESYSLYMPKYNLEHSEKYRLRLEKIQNMQALFTKEDKAATCDRNWTVGNSKKDGAKMIKDNIKLILRCFNNECEASISKVKHNTIETAEKRIQKAYETINKSGSVLGITISHDYLKLKFEELYVSYEYECKKQEEKEELILNRERMKENAKIEKEIEESRRKNEKEKQHFMNRLETLREKLANSVLSEKDQNILLKEQAVAEIGLEKCEIRDKDLDYREQNASAGYVYIISNLGAFGKDVFKIGVTRRLDPTERIDELGSASVPFRFDTHAIIFSENAFALENALHKAFKHKRVNLVNNRKEFFKVSLEEINHVLKNNFSKHFELTMEAEAVDYYESEKRRELNFDTVKELA